LRLAALWGSQSPRKPSEPRLAGKIAGKIACSKTGMISVALH
jgi:hypothetical protein